MFLMRWNITVIVPVFLNCSSSALSNLRPLSSSMDPISIVASPIRANVLTNDEGGEEKLRNAFFPINKRICTLAPVVFALPHFSAFDDGRIDLISIESDTYMNSIARIKCWEKAILYFKGTSTDRFNVLRYHFWSNRVIIFFQRLVVDSDLDFKTWAILEDGHGRFV